MMSNIFRHIFKCSYSSASFYFVFLLFDSFCPYGAAASIPICLRLPLEESTTTEGHLLPSNKKNKNFNCCVEVKEDEEAEEGVGT